MGSHELSRVNCVKILLKAKRRSITARKATGLVIPWPEKLNEEPVTLPVNPV
jgi:hypothetical protein